MANRLRSLRRVASQAVAGLLALALVLLPAGSAHAASLASQSFTTAITNTTSTPVTGLGKVYSVTLIATVTVISGGTTARAFVQTSLDGGTTWFDIAAFAFTTSTATKLASVDCGVAVTTATPATGALSDNTVQSGMCGDRLRVAFTTTGTYGSGSKVDVYYSTR